MTEFAPDSIESFESARRFQMWRYDVSHAQLLLRSVKSEGHDSRVDVLFKNVRSINLPTSFTGLRINRDGNQFTVSGAEWSGEVIAGACFHAEDSGEYFDPSPFADSLPRS